MNRANDHSKYQNWIDPKEVTPYERNAKKHDEKQIENIANSISRFGWQQDTVITRDKVLVIGHGRRLAALKLGCDMPYHVIDKDADELTDEDIRELRIADNLINSETGYDFNIGAIEIADLDFNGFDLDFSKWVEDEDKNNTKGKCEFAEVLGEENNYIVLKFNDSVSWLQLESLFPLKQVKNWSTRKDGKIAKNMERRSLGRCVDGEEFLNSLGIGL